MIFHEKNDRLPVGERFEQSANINRELKNHDEVHDDDVVDWEKTGTRTSVSAGKRKVKMRSAGRSTTTTLNVNTDVKL